METQPGLSVGALREALIEVTELEGAFGRNLHESKDVLLRVGDSYLPLGQVSVAFVGGSFCLILQGGGRDRPDVGPGVGKVMVPGLSPEVYEDVVACIERHTYSFASQGIAHIGGTRDAARHVLEILEPHMKGGS